MAYEDLINAQREFFQSNATKPVSFRTEILKELKRLLKCNERVLFDAVYKDFRKSDYETYLTELSIIYKEINIAVKRLRGWTAPKRVKTDIANFPAKSRLLSEPLGVCLIIGAWNYPYLLSLVPLISAVAAGNTVVLKPSELAPCSSAVLADLFNASFDEGHIRVVEGGVAEVTELLSYRFDKIFFTGSTGVGRIVYRAAAEHLTPVTLELGGKSPAVVCRDADIRMTAQRIVWAKFLNAGQTCVAPDYILADEAVRAELLTEIKRVIDEQHYSFENGNYVQIINNANFSRLINMIDKTKVFTGGEYDADCRYIEPTVLTDISADDAVMKEEIFGPLLPVLSFRDINEVVSFVKRGDKPLACYIFTRKRGERKRLLCELSFGGGCVNDAVMHLSNSNLPFGGVGASGIGAYRGKAGFDEFSHRKSLVMKSFLFEPALKYFPYKEWKRKLIRRI